MEEEIVAGKHAVMEALRSGRTLNKLWISETAQKHMVAPIISEAKKVGVIIQYVDNRKLDQSAAGINHQGVVAQVAPYTYAELDDLLEKAKAKDETPFLLLLDEIEDPHNLGSIIRTAECTGVHGVVIPKRRSAGVTATVSKISAGAAEHVPVARVTNMAQTIEALKAKGIWVAGADAAAHQFAYESDLKMPLAIVIGSEGKGIGRLVKEKCDFLIKLPMYGQLNSLNASVAAAVIMYEAVRQRRM
jgi:23S rRNA (guanosine2251-2'-O)-methyltransferase